MTEKGIWTEENILASDVWRVEKSIEPLSDEEQLAAWKQAVSVLGRLGGLAETLRNDPRITWLDAGPDLTEQAAAVTAGCVAGWSSRRS